MDRIHHPTAAALPPPIDTHETGGFPTAGNPATGTPATVLTAWTVHMLIEELRNVVLAAGLTPDKAATDQVAQALRGMFGGTGLATNPGYLRLANGLILQWVRNRSAPTDANGSASYTWVFPLAFPTAVLGYSYVPTNETVATNTGRAVARGPTLTQQIIHLGGGIPNEPSGIAVSGFVIGH